MERTRIHRAIVCDGCLEEIDIAAKTKMVFGERIHLCEECADKGMWICSCGHIHQEDEQCPEAQLSLK